MKITKERVGLVLIGATIIANPLTSQYVIQAVDSALVFVSRQGGAYVTLVAGAYFVGYLFYNMWKNREQIAIPAKGKKTKAQKYLAI